MPPATTTRKQPKRSTNISASRALGPQSPLVDPKVDIQSFLARCVANFETYSDEEKQEIVDSLPAQYCSLISGRKQHDGSHRKTKQSGTDHVTSKSRNNLDLPSITPRYPTDRRARSDEVATSPASCPTLPAPITPKFIADDLYIKHAIARFKRDVRDGYYEKAWQDRADKARQERAEGKFDQYVLEHADEIFGPFDTEDEDVEEESSDSESDLKARREERKRKARHADNPTAKSVKIHNHRADSGRPARERRKGRSKEKVRKEGKKSRTSTPGDTALNPFCLDGHFDPMAS